MNNELEKRVEWLNINQLSLNIKKTHYIIFTSSRRKFVVPLMLILTIML